ncbi:MAG: hypothetical protein KGK08_03970 [Acidobacteriota bacterium]|nr:hypothetical protein [Acidobacteriota bacterium]
MKLRGRTAALALLTVVVFAGGQRAIAQIGLYGGLTGAKPAAANTAWMFGPSAGVYFNRGYGVVAAGPDVRGAFLSRGDTTGSGSSESLKTLLLGYRLAVTPHVLPFKPYGEVLGGLGSLTAGQGAARTTGLHPAYGFAVGLDWTILPRLDLRALEFADERFTGNAGAFSEQILTTGVVLRLP